jgi:hypothetical protein
MWRFGMYRDGAYYELLYDVEDKNARHQAHVQNRPFFQPSFSYAVFDPQFYMTFDGEEWDKICLTMYKQANDKYMVGQDITKKGNSVVIQDIMEAHGETPVALYVSDISKGGNLTRVEMRSNETNLKSETIWNWSWEEVNGVWVPKEVSMDSVKILPEPFEIHYRLLWTKNEVNMPLEKDEFSLAKIGLKQDDNIYDSRTKKTYTINDMNFIPPVPPVIVKPKE